MGVWAGKGDGEVAGDSIAPEADPGSELGFSRIFRALNARTDHELGASSDVKQNRYESDSLSATNDLSNENPQEKTELLEAWQIYSEQNEVFDHEGRFDAAYRMAFGAGD